MPIKCVLLLENQSICLVVALNIESRSCTCHSRIKIFVKVVKQEQDWNQNQRVWREGEIPHLINVVFTFTLTLGRIIWSNLMIYFMENSSDFLCFTGVSGLCCGRRVLALLEPICVVSFTLLGSIHLISSDEGASWEAQRGHRGLAEETDGIHAALYWTFCCCAVSCGCFFLWWVRQQVRKAWKD